MKKRELFNLFLAFVASISVLFSVLLLVFNINISIKSNFIHDLERFEYYEYTYKSINREIESITISSGLTKDVTENLISIESVKRDINYYIEGYYKGIIIELDTSELSSKLDERIQEYLSNHKVKLSSSDAVNTFKNEIIESYKNEIMLYNHTDKYSSKFYKLRI